MKNNLKSNTKQKRLTDFNKSLLIYKKRSFFHKVYYKLIRIPVFYKYKMALKYLSLGLVGTTIDFVLLFILTEFLHIFYLVSAVISYFFGISANFLLNRKYTFKYESKSFFKNLQVYFTYTGISVFSLVLTLILMSVFTELFNLFYMYGKIVAALLLIIFRYFGHSRCFN